jgi:hypothetical protein
MPETVAPDTLESREAYGRAETMSSVINNGLRTTVIGQWHDRLAENTSAKRNHWQTKVTYFSAADELLTAHPGRPLTWKAVVAAARPRGCRSTFYEVAGSHARHRMIDDLIRDGGSDSVQLALRYLRADPVDQLVDETKVWSFWPYRQRLLARLANAPMPPAAIEEALTQSLVAWAAAHRSLADALDHTPPACAVEDLMVIENGRLAAMRAASRLTDLLRHC